MLATQVQSVEQSRGTRERDVVEGRVTERVDYGTMGDLGNAGDRGRSDLEREDIARLLQQVGREREWGVVIRGTVRAHKRVSKVAKADFGRQGKMRWPGGRDRHLVELPGPNLDPTVSGNRTNSCSPKNIIFHVTNGTYVYKCAA